MDKKWFNSKKNQRTMWLTAAGLIFIASLIGFIRKGSSTEAWTALVLGCAFFVFAFTVVEDK